MTYPPRCPSTWGRDDLLKDLQCELLEGHDEEMATRVHLAAYDRNGEVLYATWL